MHTIAAKAVAFGEAMTPKYKKYAGQILKNAGISLGIVLLLIIVITLINRLFKLFNGKADRWHEKIMKTMHLKDFEFFNRQRQLAILLFLLKA